MPKPLLNGAGLLDKKAFFSLMIISSLMVLTNRQLMPTWPQSPHFFWQAKQKAA
jgi:hypothetical protein